MSITLVFSPGGRRWVGGFSAHPQFAKTVPKRVRIKNFATKLRFPSLFIEAKRSNLAVDRLGGFYKRPTVIGDGPGAV